MGSNSLQFKHKTGNILIICTYFICRGVMIDGQLIEAHTVVQATATLDIFNEMTLDPKLVLLPWNPVKGKKWAQKGFHIDNLIFVLDF